MPGPFDLAFLVLFAVLWPLYSTLVDWPRHVARLRAGVPGARMRQYTSILVEEWGLIAVTAVLWWRGGRAGSALGLSLPSGWRAALGVALIVALLVLFGRQLQRVASRPAARAALRKRIAAVDSLVPHRPAELRMFLAVSLTAGICEELLFRGFLIWALRPWLGWWGAALLGVLAFGLAHAYLGRSAAIRAGITGVAMTLVYAACGSLLPGMALHALIDAGSGWTTWLVVREDAPGGGPAPAIATPPMA